MLSGVQDNAPPPRTSTSDNSQQGPIPLFDHQLKILTESFLSFFQERKKIEETYVESLAKLHRRIKVIDAVLDDRSDLNTTRSAWNEVRDNVEREAQTRQAFLNTLTVDVVNPLTAFRETQDRTRKRIKEGLKESSIAYNDYAENVLPKLKRLYLKKCQDVEDHKAAAAAPPLYSNVPTSSLGEQPNQSISSSKSNPNMSAKPVVTSPQPLRPIDRRPSGSVPPTRNRSPSTSTAFSDLAHQGKKQLNQLITFLDKSGTVKEGLGGRPDHSALRAVRSKREADEADKEYRKGVHWLETLRLRRTKILEGGYQSLEMFIFESASTIKLVLEKYTDNMTATTTTQTQLSMHARSIVDKISPEQDAALLASHTPRSLASAIPKPILYYNYSVGECNDLIFGVNLVDYATARSLGDGEIPKIVRICVKEIDQRGLESEGIYRVSGRHAVVQELQRKIERNERIFEFNPLTDDVYAVASFLKMYLRELPEPLFRYSLQDRIQHTEDRADHASSNFMLLRSKMRRLPPVHQATLKAIVEHLALVTALSERNKMDAKNLAIVFGAVIFGEDEIPKAGDLLSVQTWKDSLMEDLITNAHVLFEDPPAHSPASPPLPPAPAGEPVPTYAYGSTHTRLASVPPQPLPLRHPPEDFTPRLPPRPANSIHPSSRNALSPSREEFQISPVPMTRTRSTSTTASGNARRAQIYNDNESSSFDDEADEDGPDTTYERQVISSASTGTTPKSSRAPNTGHSASEFPYSGAVQWHNSGDSERPSTSQG